MTASLPTSTTGYHQWIPITKLQPSPLNHRKHFDPAKMEELTDNVRVQGVIVPIIARPLPGGEKFEIVAGERRYRAAKAAKLVDIPAIVRELTDAQALELQVIENNQRVDVHPLEEAEGYEALMKCTKVDGTPYCVEDIVAKVGKSRAYVYGRLKLTALGAKAREAFHAGDLDASRALLLARIPVPELQDQALEQILDPEFGDGPMPYREAAEHIQWNFMLRLKEAPFKTADATLLPAAGACTTCPKRSGNQPELFADIESADVCTDPKCFGAKRDAHLEQMREAAAAKGKDVVPANAKGYVKLDDRVKGDYQCRTYREVLGKQAPAPTLMPDATGDKAKLVEVVRKSEIQPVIAEKLKRVKAQGNSASGHDYVQERREGEAYRRKLFAHICAKLPIKLGKRELTLLVEDALDCDPEYELLEELLLPGNEGKKSPGTSQARIKQVVPKLDADGLGRLLLAANLSRDCETYGDDRRLLAVAKLYGVDAAAVKAATKAELKAAEEKPAPPATKKATAKKGKAAAAETA